MIGLHSRILATSSLLTLLAVAPALGTESWHAAAPTSGPAVSAPNAKVAPFAGSLAGEEIHGAAAVVSLPLAYRYGLQVDGLAGKLDGDGFVKVGAHLFWRDPGIGLLGLYASHSHLNRYTGIDVNRLGGEGEYYGRRWTVKARAGVEWGSSKTVDLGPETVTVDVKTRFFDKLDLDYYWTDNLKTTVGHRYQGGAHVLGLGAEWGFHVGETTMAAAFVEGRVGDSDSRAIWAGVKLYFGNDRKSLIERHRRDDPDEIEPDGIATAILSTTTTQNQTQNGTPLNTIDCEDSEFLYHPDCDDYD